MRKSLLVLFQTKQEAEISTQNCKANEGYRRDRQKKAIMESPGGVLDSDCEHFYRWKMLSLEREIDLVDRGRYVVDGLRHSRLRKLPEESYVGMKEHGIARK